MFEYLTSYEAKKKSPKKILKHFKLLIYIFYYTYECFACVCVCALCVCSVPTDIRRRHWSPWDWGYRRLCVAISALGIKPGSPERAASAPNVSPSLKYILVKRRCVRHSKSSAYTEGYNVEYAAWERIKIRTHIVASRWHTTERGTMWTWVKENK